MIFSLRLRCLGRLLSSKRVSVIGAATLDSPKSVVMNISAVAGWLSIKVKVPAVSSNFVVGGTIRKQGSSGKAIRFVDKELHRAAHTLTVVTCNSP